MEQIKPLLTDKKNIFLTLDGFRATVSFKALNEVRDNNIVTVEFPTHTSHRTHVLDYSVFHRSNTMCVGSSTTVYFGTYSGRRNDCFTIF